MRQTAKVADIGAVAADGLRLPALALCMLHLEWVFFSLGPATRRAPEIALRAIALLAVVGIANVPHLRKERDVCAHLARLATICFALRQIRLLVCSMGSHLQERHLKYAHDYLLSKLDSFYACMVF